MVRRRRVAAMVVMALALTFGSGRAQAQHLWWTQAPDQEEATCLYGEITVLESHPPIYYCGANWHPGEPAGGYCGIQHNRTRERRTIFSIWDTSATLHPGVTQADPKTLFDRFGGEGEGAHTHMLWDWREGETFRFFVRKQPGAAEGTTDTRYYVFDPKADKWRHSATISSPNGDAMSRGSVTTLGGGGLASFLENFGGGKDRDVPKIALYRLWLGPDIDRMACLTRARGDGTWGRLHDSYFLAEGDPGKLQEAFARWKGTHGEPVFGGEGKSPGEISDRPLAEGLKAQLRALPEAAATGAR